MGDPPAGYWDTQGWMWRIEPAAALPAWGGGLSSGVPNIGMLGCPRSLPGAGLPFGPKSCRPCPWWRGSCRWQRRLVRAISRGTPRFGGCAASGLAASIPPGKGAGGSGVMPGAETGSRGEQEIWSKTGVQDLELWVKRALEWFG